ncbi:transporter substrate-binding domain-containing protein [Silvanigrella paludirubra]|uniref:Transporter substrate-binding domain-containing protein n=1 Tax=Silvanigrella paludirubra TaxID=2499159 RepID=A0A6N6W063_9BACT|nr:transporter substrate-binding domain-containing protein [Silvanigrella paludirubra]KAB8041032.1 transporter substrate-binding domain-containing protein [Silvanigrella paludirubra]
MIKLFYTKFIYIILFFHLENLYASEILRICSGVSPPYIEGNMEIGVASGGIEVEIIEIIFKKLNIKYKIEIIPWAKCEFGLNAGTFDASLKVSKNSERENFILYPKFPIWESNFVFFTNVETKNLYKIESYDDVKKYKLKIGISRGNTYNKDFWESFPWIDKENKKYNSLIEVSHNHEENMRKLSENKISLYPQDKLIGIYSSKTSKYKNITYYNYTLFKKDYFQVFSKKSKFSTSQYKNIYDVLNNYNSELDKLKKSDNYNKIFKKYLK